MTVTGRSARVVIQEGTAPRSITRRVTTRHLGITHRHRVTTAPALVMADVPGTADAPVTAAGTGMAAEAVTMAVVQVIAHYPRLRVQGPVVEAGMATPEAARALADRVAVATSIATAVLAEAGMTVKVVAAGRSSHELQASSTVEVAVLFYCSLILTVCRCCLQ